MHDTRAHAHTRTHRKQAHSMDDDDIIINDIMDLLEICLETNFKTLDGTIWTQKDGCPIGKLISGEIAEIYMTWYEEKYIFYEVCSFKPLIYIEKNVG